MNTATHAATSGYPRPQSVDDITQQNVKVMRELEHAAMLRRTTADKVACFVATFCGSMTFVWLHVALFTAWIAFNTLPAFHHPDPFPFTFLTLMVSLEAIFLSAFILISQNYEMRLTERRAQLDLQINLLSEQENTKMLSLLEQIACKLGVIDDDDPSVKVLEEATRPAHLVEQIERAYRADARDEEAGTKQDT